MTNIQTVSNGTFFTTASAEEIEGQITRGMQWLTLRPGGSLLNLAHVVSIEDDREPAQPTTALEDDRPHAELACTCITPTHKPGCPSLGHQLGWSPC